MAPPQILPPEADRPKRTSHLVVFENAIESLNDLYWGARAGFSVLHGLSAQGDAALGVIPAAIRAHWDVLAADVPQRLMVEGTLLRRVCVVQAVAVYEDYVRAIVESAIRLQPLPSKKPRLQVDLGVLPVGQTVEQFVMGLWVAHKTREVLDEGYERRLGAIENALGIDLDNTQPALTVDRPGVAVACEVRNCIAHAAGRVDDRTLERAGTVVPGMTLGSELVLEEAVLWRLLGALRGHAQAVDLLTRIKYPALAGR